MLKRRDFVVALLSVTATLAVVAFAVERVCTKEWTPDNPQAAQAVEAAWNAIRQ